MTNLSLFAGPPPSAGAERFAEHARRLGQRPPGNRGLIDTLDRSGLVGRGGASFPVATKWRAVQSRARGRAVVIVNGAEGEPLSRKDQTLMTLRPHLVIDHPAEPDPAWRSDAPTAATSKAPWRLFNIGNNKRVELSRYIGAIEAAYRRWIRREARFAEQSRHRPQQHRNEAEAAVEAVRRMRAMRANGAGND